MSTNDPNLAQMAEEATASSQATPNASAQPSEQPAVDPVGLPTADPVADPAPVETAVPKAEVFHSQFKNDHGDIIMVVDGEGTYQWAEKALEMIADDASWNPKSMPIRQVLKTLWNVQIDPPNSRDTFMNAGIDMPDTIQYGTQEWYSEFNWRLWQKAVQFGQQYLLEVSKDDFAKITPTVAAMLVLADRLSFTAGSGEPISAELWNTFNDVSSQLRALVPTFARLGTHCDHHIAPVANEAGEIVSTVCVICQEPFKLYTPPEKSPEQQAAEEQEAMAALAEVMGQQHATSAPVIDVASANEAMHTLSAVLTQSEAEIRAEMAAAQSEAPAPVIESEAKTDGSATTEVPAFNGSEVGV